MVHCSVRVHPSNSQEPFPKSFSCISVLIVVILVSRSVPQLLVSVSYPTTVSFYRRLVELCRWGATELPLSQVFIHKLNVRDAFKAAPGFVYLGWKFASERFAEVVAPTLFWVATGVSWFGWQLKTIRKYCQFIIKPLDVNCLLI